MALNYTDAKAMYEASERHPNLTTMISPPPHFMRGDRAVRKMINEGYIGEPRNVVVQSYADAYLDPSKAKHWRQDWDISGLNVLDMGMMIEVMHRWLGYTKRVTAMAQTFTKERPDGSGGTAKVERRIRCRSSPSWRVARSRRSIAAAWRDTRGRPTASRFSGLRG